MPLQVPLTQASSLVQALLSSQAPPVTGIHLVLPVAPPSWIEGLQARHGSPGFLVPMLTHLKTVDGTPASFFGC